MDSNARDKDPHLVVLDCIRNFIADHSYPPTISEIGKASGLRSKGTVAAHLRTLRDLGLLTWQPGQERTFVITDLAWAALEIIKAFLDFKGVPSERKRARRYLLRNVLRRPEVCEAINAALAERGLGMQDAVDLHIGHIRGTQPAVHFTRDDKCVVYKPGPSWPALREYFRITGISR